MVVFFLVKSYLSRVRSEFSLTTNLDWSSPSWQVTQGIWRTTTTRAFWTPTGTGLNRVKEWSVSLSGLSRLRTVGPHQKLGRHETGSLLDLTQSSQRLSHLNVTQTSGIMMSPSPSLRRYSPTWNPNCPGPSLPLMTDRSSYHYLRFYWIWANWAIRTTFRIGPSKDGGTYSESRTA